MKPETVVFFSSYRCDSRCLMCSCWKKQAASPEISLEQAEKIFSDRILKRSVRYINLTGGEPTARPDIVELADLLQSVCKGVQRIDMPTNGINSERVVDAVERILARFVPHRVGFNVTVSIDGVGAVHERVRGVSGIFDKVSSTLDELLALAKFYPSLSVSVNTTVVRENVNQLEGMLQFAKDKGVGINFTPAAVSFIGVESGPVRNNFELDPGQKEKAAQFFEKLMKDKVISERYCMFVVNWLMTGKRSLPCSFRRGHSLLIEPTGDAYYCGNYPHFKIGNLIKDRFEKLGKHPWWDAPQCHKCNSNCYL